MPPHALRAGRPMTAETPGSLRQRLIPTPSLRAATSRWPVLAGALAAAAVAALTVAAGAAPGSDLGRGIARLLPAADVALAALVAALLVLDPWAGLVGWALLMPIVNTAGAQIWFGQLQILPTTAFLGALALGWVLRPADARPAARTRTVGLAWLIAGLVTVLAILSTVASRNSGGATIALHGLIEPALVAAIAVTLRPTRRQVLALLLALAGGAALASVFNVLRLGRVVATYASVEAARSGLAHFTYFNVGIFGDVLAMSMPVLFAALLLRRPLRIGPLGIALAAVGLAVSAVALYLTFSKSAWMGAAIGLAIVAVLAIPSVRGRVAALVVAAILGSFVVPYPLFVMNAVNVHVPAYEHLLADVQGSRFGTWDPDTPGGEVSITERVLATQAAVKMTADHPLLGVGPGGFAAAYAGPYHPAKATRNLQHAHNFVANLASEFGLPMTILVVLAMLAALAAAIRAFRRDPPFGRAVALVVLASLVSFLVVSSTFGLDLYRAYRAMNSDVLQAALLVACAAALWVRPAEADEAV